MDVVLRPMTRADLPMLARWLREPRIAEWWHEDAAGDALERRYGPSIDGRDPARLRIALETGAGGTAAPVGMIQWYSLGDEPEYAAELRPWVPVPPDAWSLDYLVSAQAHRGRGIGTAMVRAALAEVGPAVVIVPVHERNGASAAILRRNGFVRVASAELDPDNPHHSRRHAVYRRVAH